MKKYFKYLYILILISFNLNADKIYNLPVIIVKNVSAVQKVPLVPLVPLVPNIIISSSKCQSMFKKYNIDPKIRSVKGWKRVYKSGHLLDFLNIKKTFLKSKDSKKKLLQCLIANGFNIQIDTFTNKQNINKLRKLNDFRNK